MIAIESFASSSHGNSYFITDGKTPLLLEAGIPFSGIQRRLHFKTSEIAGCLISHEHNDHSKAVKEVTRSGIDCYMSRGTAESIGATGHRVHTLEPLHQFEIGSWTILPFDTEHDAQDPIGFLMANTAGDKLLFATDTYYIRYLFQELTHIMVECNYAKDILAANVASGAVPPAMKRRLIQSHFSLDHVKEFFQANDLSRVQEIWILHLSDGNSDEARFKREIQELTGKLVFVAQS